MGGKSGQTIGYHYLFSILFGLGRGPINQLKSIMVADKLAWDREDGCTDDVLIINKPNLFGGEKKEGGVQGPFGIFFGADDQVLPGARPAIVPGSGPASGHRVLNNVKTEVGGLVSEMRGTTMVWFDGLVCSMNPYPKPWSFRVRRYSAGWYNNECFYPAKSVIFLADGKIHAMNPAHIIYQCLTDPLWGRGLPTALIDENSFVAAANQLCAEGFGLCFAWQRKEEVDAFIDIVQSYIDSTLYPDPETGKMVLRLLRDDYDAEDLPIFAPASGLLDITEDDSSSQDEIINEIIGQGFDPITKEQFTVRVHNNAARQSQGSPNPEQLDRSGIPTRDLMGRALWRDLKKYCSGLKKYVVQLDRSGWRIRPGMPFRVSDPRRGITQVILRAIEISDQSFKDGRITIKCTEDVFGLPDTAYTTVGDTSWTPPATDAVPATAERLMEANYRDILLRDTIGDANALTETNSIIGVVAVSPDPVMYQFDLLSRASGETDFFSTGGSFTGAATLVDAITPLQTSFEITGETNWPEDIVGQAIVIDDEQILVTDYDAAAHMLTVERGVTDTIPQAHAAAATIWTIDDDFISDRRVYESGETVEAKVLTRTTSDLLDPTDADLMSLAVVGRQYRPYAPGDVKVDGTSVYLLTGEHPTPVFTWANRNRILQADQLVSHTDPDVAAEDGQYCNFRLYKDDGATLLREEGIAGTTFTYSTALQTTDGATPTIWVEVESVRNSVHSYQHYRFPVRLQGGYGLGYGLNYGGA